MRLSTFIIVLFLSIPPALGQELQLLKSFDIGYSPSMASIDRQGYLYFSSQTGGIDKYNQDGELIYHFSPQKQGSPTVIDAWQSLKTFVYYRDFQEYLFLDRFLNSSERYPINLKEFNNFSGLATIAGDNNLWLINDQEQSLIKVDINNGEIILENRLNLLLDIEDLEVAFIRSYQNHLFISDLKNGIFIFDNLGNLLDKLVAENINFFSFIKNDLLFVKDNKLTFLNFYTQTKKEVSLPDLSYQYVFMENNKILVVRDSTIDIFKLNSN